MAGLDRESATGAFVPRWIPRQRELPMRAFREILAAGCITAILGGCIPERAPKPEPVTIRTIDGSYRNIAGCAYEALQQRIGQVAKVDLPAGINIERGEQYVLYWILEIRPSGTGQTSLGIRPGPWMIGERLRSEDVIPLVVAACG